MDVRRPGREVVTSSTRASLLTRIPLPLRVVFYAGFFLAVVLGALPTLAHQGGLKLLPWHFEIGVWRWVGWVFFGITLVVYLACSHILTNRGRGAYVEFDPPTEFVASGPFRWCRNPIAGCVVLMLLGLAIAFSSTGIFILFTISILLAHLQVVLLEEPLLRERFGQEYEDYLARVPRWVPRVP